MRQAKPSLFISLSFHCSESLIGNLQNFYSMHNLTLQAVGKKSVDFFFPHGDQRKGIVVYNEQSLECKDYQKIPGEDQRKTRE